MQLPPDNRLATIRKEFHRKLDDHYGERETDSLFTYLAWYFLGMSKSDLHMNPDLTVSESELLKFHFALKDLIKFRPVQYITGETEFCGLKVLVNENVLIPRPETEELVYLVREECRSNGKVPDRIIDLCTGSGCIALALQKFFPGSRVTGTDVSSAALKTAAENAELNYLPVNFIESDLLNTDFKEFSGEFFDIIVSNPPYISLQEAAQMSPNVLDYEPGIALFAGADDPLVFYKKISVFAGNNLKEGGMVFLEINENYSEETRQVFSSRFKRVEVRKDMQDKPRFLICFS